MAEEIVVKEPPQIGETVYHFREDKAEVQEGVVMELFNLHLPYASAVVSTSTASEKCVVNLRRLFRTPQEAYQSQLNKFNDQAAKLLHRILFVHQELKRLESPIHAPA
jgi:hypothetical protein